MPKAAEVTLYLEEWQKRMLKDFTKLPRIDKITKVVIRPRKGYCPASYKVPVEGLRRDDWLLYLTDQQMLQVREQLGLRTSVASVNVTAAVVESGQVAFV